MTWILNIASPKKEQNLHKLLSQVEGSYELTKLLHVVEVINTGLYPWDVF